MAERKFDYQRISEIYKNMQQIVGNSTDADSIAGVLNTANKHVNENIDVRDMALYGDLGKQLLLDWENTSANFNNYIDKFYEWCELIAAAGGQYNEFEQKVAGFKEVNPFGVAGVGLNANYIDSSDYADMDGKYFDELKNSLMPLFAETGATYIDTGAVENEKNRKIWAWVDWGVSAAGVVLDAVGIGLAAKAAATGAKAATTAISTVVRDSADDVIVNSADDVLRLATKEVAENSVDDVLRLTSKEVAENSVDDVLRLATKDTAKEVAENSVDDTIRAFVTTDPKTGKIITSYNPPPTQVDILDDAGRVIASYTDDIVETAATTSARTASNAAAQTSKFGSKVKDFFSNFGSKMKSGVTTSGLADDVASQTAKEVTEDAVANATRGTAESFTDKLASNVTTAGLKETTEQAVKETTEEVVKDTAAKAVRTRTDVISEALAQNGSGPFSRFATKIKNFPKDVKSGIAAIDKAFSSGLSPAEFNKAMKEAGFKAYTEMRPSDIEKVLEIARAATGK